MNGHDYYMNMAKTATEDCHICPSRRFGAVIVGSLGNIISTGYNGPPMKVWHPEERLFKYNDMVLAGKNWFTCNNRWYRDVFLHDILDEHYIDHFKTGEHYVAIDAAGDMQKQRLFIKDGEYTDRFVLTKTFDTYVCPRKAFGIPSGEKLEMCGCQHAETNAIDFAANSGASVNGAALYLWGDLPSGPPCINCAGAIINSGIKKVIIQQSEYKDYSRDTRMFFKWAGVDLIEVEYNK